MKKVASLWLLGATVLAASDSAGQVLYRRPYDSAHGITAGYDTNGGAGGCADYACGGNCYDGHTGTDFGVPIGTPILAAAGGTVVTVMTGCPDVGYICSPCGGRCGNHVRVRHADGSETLYCHMQSGGMTVSNGQAVGCGQQLGRSASSGCSSGPHVHFGFYPSGGWSADDPFRGACGGPVSRWTGQGNYGSIPGAACMCSPSPEACNGRDDDCDGAVDEGDVCEVALLVEQPTAYAPPDSTDVNGDGRADVCARGSDGVFCWAAADGGWAAPFAAVPLSDALGWADATNYATLRMGDVDGDGRADVCARSDSAFSCALSNGEGFGAFEVWRDGLSDVNAWNQPQYYTTIRLADANGDGRDDLCARDSQGFGCWLSNGTAFDRRIEGPRWSDANGYTLARYYGTLRMGDVNGDRRDDVCIRSSAGVDCYLSDGEGFPASTGGPAWSDQNGFGAVQFWSTLRLADVDGDRRDDLCVRTSTDLRCALATEAGFGESVILGALSDVNGWGDATNYATLRVGDIDGDGRKELCARADAQMGCWSWSGTEGLQRPGPAWGDVSGWGVAKHYETIRLADFDGDGRDDLCARAIAGWRCHPSRGDSFGDAVALDSLTDASGWSAPQYWSTILSAGRACIPAAETCNGRDDDCDGMVDEGEPETCNGRDDDCDGMVDEGETEICNAADDDCDGAIDEDLACGPASADGGPDGEGQPLDGGPRQMLGETLGGGCACRSDGAGPSASGFAMTLLVLGAVLLRRRRVPSRTRAPAETRARS